MDDIRIDCERVLALVPNFVDDEVSGDVAASVRGHLIDCASCRVAVQEATALRQWFEPVAEESADVEVPAGFAARVTELAFAGAESAESETEESARIHTIEPARERHVPRLVTSGAAAAASDDSPERNLTFAMALTAVAAAILMVFTLLIASGGNGSPEEDLTADEPLRERIQRLNEMQESEGEAPESR